MSILGNKGLRLICLSQNTTVFTRILYYLGWGPWPITKSVPAKGLLWQHLDQEQADHVGKHWKGQWPAGACRGLNNDDDDDDDNDDDDRPRNI